MSSVAVFWDRDNTLIRDPGYISDPGQVELLPRTAEALQRLSAAGFQNIVVTNQSGLARGMFDEAALERIHDRMITLFAEQGAKIDAIYFCPYLAGEEAKVERYRQDSELRKPKPGMILQASLERKIELAGSWMVGDSLHDAQAGRAAGCRTIVIRRPDAETVRKGGDVDFVVDSVVGAAETVLKYTRRAGGGGDRPAAPARAEKGPAPAKVEKTVAPVKAEEAKTAVEAEIVKEPVQTERGTAPESEGEAAPRDTAGPTGEVPALLQEILTLLRTAERRLQGEEFSLGKLVGAIVQIAAVGALIWAVFGWLRDVQPPSELLMRLQFATLLQLIALTCFSLSPRK